MLRQTRTDTTLLLLGVAKLQPKGILLAGLLVTVLLGGACGGQAVPSASEPKQVDITLSEFRVESSRIAFAKGTTYRFNITNKGQAPHDFMVMPPGHQGHMTSVLHVEADALPPGSTMAQDSVFTAAGTYEMDCHIPGHYEAGMKLTIQAPNAVKAAPVSPQGQASLDQASSLC